MRTKAKVLCAAALAAGALTSMAQVYSANIVGYYNVSMTPGLNLTANQLDAGGNSLNEVLPNTPAGWHVLKFDRTISDYTKDESDGAVWLDFNTGNPTTTHVAPGEGFFVENTDAAAQNITFVGQVETGTLTMTMPPGLKLVSTITPSALGLYSSNSFPQQAGMHVLYYSPTLHDYVKFENTGSDWADFNTGDPASVVPAVGQGYFIENVDAGVTYSWTRTFNP